MRTKLSSPPSVVDAGASVSLSKEDAAETRNPSFTNYMSNLVMMSRSVISEQADYVKNFTQFLVSEMGMLVMDNELHTPEMWKKMHGRLFPMGYQSYNTALAAPCLYMNPVAKMRIVTHLFLNLGMLMLRGEAATTVVENRPYTQWSCKPNPTPGGDFLGLGLPSSANRTDSNEESLGNWKMCLGRDLRIQGGKYISERIRIMGNVCVCKNTCMSLSGYSHPAHGYIPPFAPEWLKGMAKTVDHLAADKSAVDPSTGCFPLCAYHPIVCPLKIACTRVGFVPRLQTNGFSVRVDGNPENRRKEVVEMLVMPEKQSQAGSLRAAESFLQNFKMVSPEKFFKVAKGNNKDLVRMSDDLCDLAMCLSSLEGALDELQKTDNLLEVSENQVEPISQIFTILKEFFDCDVESEEDVAKREQVLENVREGRFMHLEARNHAIPMDLAKILDTYVNHFSTVYKFLLNMKNAAFITSVNRHNFLSINYKILGFKIGGITNMNELNAKDPTFMCTNAVILNSVVAADWPEWNDTPSNSMNQPDNQALRRLLCGRVNNSTSNSMWISNGKVGVSDSGSSKKRLASAACDKHEFEALQKYTSNMISLVKEKYLDSPTKSVDGASSHPDEGQIKSGKTVAAVNPEAMDSKGILPCETMQQAQSKQLPSDVDLGEHASDGTAITVPKRKHTNNVTTTDPKAMTADGSLLCDMYQQPATDGTENTVPKHKHTNNIATIDPKAMTADGFPLCDMYQQPAMPMDMPPQITLGVNDSELKASVIGELGICTSGTLDEDTDEEYDSNLEIPMLMGYHI